jgi:hypothetical protein
MVRLAVLALCAALIPGCKKGNDNPTPPTVVDTTPPRVASTAPADGAVDVPMGTAIVIVFSEAIDCATFEASFTLVNPGGPVPGSGCMGNTVTFFISLNYSTTYRIRIAPTVKDLAGNPLGSEYVFSFTTMALPDTTSPTLIDSSPTGAAPANTTVRATFSEPMKCSTINTDTFTLTDAGNARVAGTVSCAGAVATFTPTGPLTTGATYVAWIAPAVVQDLAGNPFGGWYWTFSVRVPVQMTEILEPLASSMQVATVSRVSVLFNDQMDPASFGAGSFYIEDPDGGRPALAFDVSGNSATATPATRLRAATTYTVHLNDGIKAQDGTPLTPPATWTFTTVPQGSGTWMATATSGAPSARSGHTAVWTGSKMLVWGGSAGTHLNDGGLYDPATDTWSAISTTGAPIGRTAHVAVWTGSELIVWGGFSGSAWLNSGGRYTPATNTWTTLPITNAPSPRVNATAVWTGSEMLVWGGYGANGYLGDGGIFNLSTGWSAMPSGPTGRVRHSAVWSGTEMLIWGGDGLGGFIPDGVCYTPGVGWDPMYTTNQPIFRNGQSAVWTGSEMIVWGGANWNGAISSGGRYSPATGWTALPDAGAPYPRTEAPAVWSGSEMIVWGVYYDTGGRYSPANDAWTATASEGAPGGRSSHTAVWTGTEMIVWGGYVPGGSATNTGGRYAP